MHKLLSKWWKKVRRTNHRSPTIYYIAGDGNDAHDGRHPLRAWQSIERLNQAKNSINANDQILYKRGYCYPGLPFYLHLPDFEKNIGIYGSGDYPVFPQIETKLK
jgi:hypothetical protein